MLSWLGALALVVLGARSIAYAVSPSPLAAHLRHAAGGPQLPVVAAVALALAVAISAALVWLAALGVRERATLEGRPHAVPPLRIRRLLGRAVALALGAMPTFALLESYLHMRAGLGWHGLHCLTGPVHRNAIPILVALALVTAALASALEHVIAWMRRTLASLSRPRRLPSELPSQVPPPRSAPPRCHVRGGLGARAPPVLA